MGFHLIKSQVVESYDKECSLWPRNSFGLIWATIISDSFWMLCRRMGLPEWVHFSSLRNVITMFVLWKSLLFKTLFDSIFWKSMVVKVPMYDSLSIAILWFLVVGIYFRYLRWIVVCCWAIKWKYSIRNSFFAYIHQNNLRPHTHFMLRNCTKKKTINRKSYQNVCTKEGESERAYRVDHFATINKTDKS